MPDIPKPNNRLKTQHQITAVIISNVNCNCNKVLSRVLRLLFTECVMGQARV